MKASPSTFAYILYCASVALSAPIKTKRQSGTSYDGGITANDVQDGVCAPVTLIFARGSTEQGNMGSTVGPALAQALISALGADGVAVQGVDYSATIGSNISLGADGGPELADLANQALQQCPKTKIAIAGYSQGAMVCHFAVEQGGLSAADVSAAVLYGDPLLRSPIEGLDESRVKEFCASGDGVCETGGFAITPAHLSYTTGGDIDEGASFIVQNAGTSSGAESPTSSGTTPSSPSSETCSPESTASATDPVGGNLPAGSSTNPFGSIFPSGSSTNPFGSIFPHGSSTNPFGSIFPHGSSTNPFGSIFPHGSSTNPFGSLTSPGFGSGSSGFGSFGGLGSLGGLTGDESGSSLGDFFKRFF